MPEGDTIHSLSTRLHAALAGLRVTRTTGDAPGLRGADLGGCHISRVSARGKHLLIHFDDGHVLRTHLRMQGRWRIVRGAQRAHIESRRHEVALHTESLVAVCLLAPDVELRRGEERLTGLQGLGPDLLANGFTEQVDDALARLSRSTETLGVALMNQRNVAGIGNVYKSELLFMHRLNPFAPVASVERERLADLLTDARKWLLRNARAPGPRRTRFGDGPALHVYRRAGEHCLVCGTTIRMLRQGPRRRSTYFCAACQGVG